MKHLAKETSLEFDGSKEETRLFTEMINTFSSNMSKKEYAAMEKDLNEYSIQGKGFQVYAWNDCSGYEYWTKQQEEDNYIQVTVSITGRNPDPKEIKKAAQKAYDYFYCKYSRN
jgi:hypothetical protein